MEICVFPWKAGFRIIYKTLPAEQSKPKFSHNPEMHAPSVAGEHRKIAVECKLSRCILRKLNTGKAACHQVYFRVVASQSFD